MRKFAYAKGCMRNYKVVILQINQISLICLQITRQFLSIKFSSILFWFKESVVGNKNFYRNDS